MYEDTKDKKLGEIDNSIKQQKIERIEQVVDMQQVNNELKRKFRNLEDRSRRDNLRIDGIPEHDQESRNHTEEILKDALQFKLKVPIELEQKKEVKAELWLKSSLATKVNKYAILVYDKIYSRDKL